jgi:hypothetical protein
MVKLAPEYSICGHERIAEKASIDCIAWFASIAF